MNIGLYDVDSKIPNLALMKLSQWHKMQGHTTSLFLPLLRSTYDNIYASKIFKFSHAPHLTDDMVMGGTGINLTTNLEAEIEKCEPDYALYNFPHNIGFSQRGCRFRCGFCVVPEKEGRPKSAFSIEDLWTQRSSDFLWLLDNDFFGNPEWRERIEEIRHLNLRVSFLQGLNIRIITEEQAAALKSVRFRNKAGTHSICSFAWDRIRDEKLIKRGIERLQAAGIKTWQMQFFVLIGYDTTKEEDLHRVMWLKSIGADPFAMPYDKNNAYQKHFCRWVNRREIFKSCTWEEYRHGSKK